MSMVLIPHSVMLTLLIGVDSGGTGERVPRSELLGGGGTSRPPQ